MVEEFIQNLENHEKPSRKNRSKSYYRHQRNRSIKRKMEIAKFGWFYNREDEVTPKDLGKLNKGKVYCSCPLCRYEQHNGIEKHKYQVREREAKKEIEEYC